MWGRNKLLKNLDSLKVSTEGERFSFSLTGWALLPGEEELQLRLLHNGKEETGLCVKYEERPDVSSTYPRYAQVKTPGFRLLFEAPVAEILPEDQLEVVITTKSRTRSFWKTGREGIGPWQNRPPLLLQTGELLLGETLAVISGTVVSSIRSQSRSYSFEIYNSRGERSELSCLCTGKREEAGAYLWENGEERVDFRLLFLYEEGEEYRLLASNGAEIALQRIKGDEVAEKAADERLLRQSPPKNPWHISLHTVKCDAKLFWKKGREALAREWRRRYLPQELGYHAWYEAHRLTARDGERQREEAASFSGRWQALIEEGQASGRLLASLKEQTCPCFAAPLKREELSKRETQGENWLLLVGNDQVLAPEAAYEFLAAAEREPESELLYADEDCLTPDGRFHLRPQLWPDFDAELFGVCQPGVIFLREALLWRSVSEGAERIEEMIAKAMKRARGVQHIPRVLSHRLLPALPRWQQRREPSEKRESLVKGTPLVSVLIPNRDHADCLARCVRSLLEKTSYPHYEILLLDNNSAEEETFALYRELATDPRIRILSYDKPFHYAEMNNQGAAEAKGEYLLLLNNDTEVLEGDWLTQMLAACQRERVGAVGARLLYPDGRLQHAGVVIGMGGVAGHLLRMLPAEAFDCYPFENTRREVGAVTAACLLTPRSVYEEVGGMERELAVAFNDVDFCLKIRQAGYRILYEPGATLRHHESLSRGNDDTPEKRERFEQEKSFMKNRWRPEAGDPFYNASLSLRSPFFVLRREDEEERAKKQG